MSFVKLSSSIEVEASRGSTFLRVCELVCCFKNKSNPLNDRSDLPASQPETMTNSDT